MQHQFLSVILASVLALSPVAPAVGQPRVFAANAEERPAADFTRARLTLGIDAGSIATDPTFGLELADAIEPFVAAIGLTGQGGALVVAVRRGGAASVAGLMPGDIIVSANGMPLRDGSHFVTLLRETGEVEVPLGVIRVGRGAADLVAQLQAVAAAGNRDALLALADAAWSGLWPGQLREAEGHYLRVFEMGDARAAYRLGQMYATGRGVDIDLAVATRWYRTASQMDLPAGHFGLGLTWWSGRYWTGLALVGDYAEAVRLFTLAAARGHAPAYRYLGLAHQLGYGTEPDFITAAEWYEQAMAAGDLEAMYRRALMIEAGQGGDPDPERALDLLMRAGHAGSVDANRRLGEKYWRGEGVMQHPIRAIGYLTAAAQQGDRESMSLIARILLSGYGVRRDEAGAVAWYFRAYQAGDADAGYALALAYADGIGVAPDLAKVAGFMFEAIRRGSAAALAEMKSNAEAWDVEVRMDLQELLAANGYYAGEIDGVFGPGTQRALDAAAMGG